MAFRFPMVGIFSKGHVDGSEYPRFSRRWLREWWLDTNRWKSRYRPSRCWGAGCAGATCLAFWIDTTSWTCSWTQLWYNVTTSFSSKKLWKNKHRKKNTPAKLWSRIESSSASSTNDESRNHGTEFALLWPMMTFFWTGRNSWIWSIFIAAQQEVVLYILLLRESHQQWPFDPLHVIEQSNNLIWYNSYMYTEKD